MIVKILKWEEFLILIITEILRQYWVNIMKKKCKYLQIRMERENIIMFAFIE